MYNEDRQYEQPVPQLVPELRADNLILNDENQAAEEETDADEAVNEFVNIEIGGIENVIEVIQPVPEPVDGDNHHVADVIEPVDGNLEAETGNNAVYGINENSSDSMNKSKIQSINNDDHGTNKSSPGSIDVGEVVNTNIDGAITHNTAGYSANVSDVTVEIDDSPVINDQGTSGNSDDPIIAESPAPTDDKPDVIPYIEQQVQHNAEINALLSHPIFAKIDDDISIEIGCALPKPVQRTLVTFLIKRQNDPLSGDKPFDETVCFSLSTIPNT